MLCLWSKNQVKKCMFTHSKHLLFFALIAFCACISLSIISLLPKGKTPSKVGVALEKVQDAIPPLLVIDKAEAAAPAPTTLPEYIEVVDGCGPYYDGECINVRSAPSVDAPSVIKLRKGVVLKVSGKVEAEGREWYKIVFDEWVRYPDRISHDWYVATDVVEEFTDSAGTVELTAKDPQVTEKYIVVDKSEEMLYAYEGDTVYMKEPISIGLDDTPTPRGTFQIFKKTPSRYMQGPVPGVSDQAFDLPGVPWTMYFTAEGAAVHGAYWHNHFGQPWSHGCVNLPPEKAKELYLWADIGTPVTVRD